MAAMQRTVATDPGGSQLAAKFQQLAMAVLVAGPSVSEEITLGGGFGRLAIEIQNLGPTNVFDAVTIEAQAHPLGSWFTYVTDAQINTGTAVAGLFDLIVGDLDDLAAAANAMIVLITTGLHAVRITLSSATGAVTANIYATAGR